MSASFFERYNGFFLCPFVLNDAINSKALGPFCYCDSLFYLDILPSNIFLGPGTDVD